MRISNSNLLFRLMGVRIIDFKHICIKIFIDYYSLFGIENYGNFEIKQVLISMYFND